MVHEAPHSVGFLVIYSVWDEDRQVYTVDSVHYAEDKYKAKELAESYADQENGKCAYAIHHVRKFT